MAWLHENLEEFKNAILFTARQNRLSPVIVEKDYYVTLVLKGLKERLPFADQNGEGRIESKSRPQ